MPHLVAAADPTLLESFLQHCLIGLTNGSLIALIAIGYTMVYGIIGLINFAHGDLFMLGSCLALTLMTTLAATLGVGLAGSEGLQAIWIAGTLIVCSLFCAGLNMSVDWAVYKPLRNAPKLAPLVSAIGVSFIFMNLGLFWLGPADTNFPNFVSADNIFGEEATLRFTWKDLLVVGTTVPLMIALTVFVKFTRLGTAMRATEQSQQAAALMGINVDRVISLTFGIGGALAGAASVIYSLFINTISFQMGFTNGLYAFTAAVLGGIGNIPGAVLGGLLIGLVRSIGSAYIGEKWTSALIFAILIVILVFRPSGLLGSHAKEKV
jgi:branched-chain amino acid transport system permease protein